jgi:putative transposase
MHEDLVAEETSISLNRVARVIAIHGIQMWLLKSQGRLGRRSRRLLGIRNHLEQDFSALESNSKWVTDLT